VESFELYPHLYADDTRIYGFCRPGDTDSLRKRVADCVAAVADWMRSNRLQLNASKTEVLWCASARRQSQLPSDPLAVGSDLVSPVSCVRDLGIFIDADLTMRTQVTQTCSKCFAALRQLRSIRRSVSNDVMQSLIVALVFSRLDYGSATLAGLPKQLMDRLQSVQNAAARLIFKACRRDHIQPLLRRLHWLRMPERISFRLAVLVYRCFHGSAPGYLASDLQRVSHLNARRRLCASTTSALVVPRTVRATIGDRTFPATAASVWNNLPESVRSSPSLQVFRSRLKTELFAWSYNHD